MNVCIEFGWLDAAPVVVDTEGRLTFPSPPAKPGIYSFRWRDGEAARVYIGETDNLRRRLVHYRNPGLTQPTNRRLNATLTAHLAAGGSAELATATGATLLVDGRPMELGLSWKPHRLLLENAALVLAS